MAFIFLSTDFFGLNVFRETVSCVDGSLFEMEKTLSVYLCRDASSQVIIFRAMDNDLTDKLEA